MLSQKLQQKLLQKLSPQQIQLMKLLQIPTIALEQRIKQEIEENPALEDAEENDEINEDLNNDRELSDDKKDNEDSQSEENSDDEFDLSDYVDTDEIPAYKLSANNHSMDDDDKQMPFVSGKSFHDLLFTQLGLRSLDERQYNICSNIIGNLDDSGYIQRDLHALVDDLAFSQNIKTTYGELLSLLKIIQEFDPPGVGARNLKECLLIQLKKIEKTLADEEIDEESPDSDAESVRLGLLIIEKYFVEFTKKHYSKILKRGNITEDELKIAINEILKLNPKPGNSLGESSKTNYYIISDFIISIRDGELGLQLNSRNTPELRLSRTYTNMLENLALEKKKNKASKDALMFVKQKIDSAKWFIDAIKQRQHTLYTTMKAIMDYQKDYFLEGDETLLKPMILKDIAEIVNLDISTVSRVANSKYVQTPFGTMLIKTFFSESMQTDSGEEVSTKEVKKILSNCVESENKKKPLTDEQLAAVLKEKGYNIARRTVAKYREQLSIPVARLRKEL